uniref:Uncharacterized protein n=1 Tax=candidate division WOR-3 bacterium TaxID=2052148 RepID=A0A7V3KP55_UNCW3
MTQEEILIWSWIGGVLGATVGTIGGIIGAKNSRRVRNGEESWLTLARWNLLDWFNSFLVGIGLIFSIAGTICEALMVNWVSARWLLNLGIIFLGVGAGGWISRARALMKKGGS